MRWHDPGRGRFGTLNGALLLAACLGLALFVRVEMRSASPPLRLAMIRDPVLCAGLAMGALVSAVLMATLVVGPFYLPVPCAWRRPRWGWRWPAGRWWPR